MPVHAFVDETKVRGLLVLAAVLEPRDLAPSRAAMRNLLLPRQSRLHFVKERDDRKRHILNTVTCRFASASTTPAGCEISELRANCAWSTSLRTWQRCRPTGS